MKINNKIIALLSVLTLLNLSCAEDSDIKLIDHNQTYYREGFSNVTVDGSTFQLEGWTNYNEVGTKKWTGEFFSGNGSVAFSAFGSKEPINIGWLISPPIDMNVHEGEKMTFLSQHNFLRSRDNSLQLLVSTDFDGTNVKLASWINIPVRTPTPDTPRFRNVYSGEIDLSEYEGTLYFAFRVKGSGTNSNLGGTYQIDDINIYYPSK